MIQQFGACHRISEEGLMPATMENFRCMMCGHEYQEKVEKDEDKERGCPKCRSNSIRHLKKKGTATQE
jgi:predicted Zn-ribbon and HTH transcriptional regulator